MRLQKETSPTRFVWAKFLEALSFFVAVTCLISFIPKTHSKMVTLPSVLASNARISTTLPKALVAVFAGATRGIGEATLKTWIRYAIEPRIYLFTRSVASGERLISECKSINPQAKVIPIQADLSSIKETDRACKVVLDAEERVNLLIHSAGEVKLDKSLTSEGLHIFVACVYYSKLRTIQQLLPRLQSASQNGSLARVVAIAGGTKEGQVDLDDLPAVRMPMAQMRGHLTSMITLSLEQLAQSAPTVSFVHDYPGTIRTGLRDNIGGMIGFMQGGFKVYCWLAECLGWAGFLGLPEVGERHVFLATSAMYPPKQSSGNGMKGVPVGDGLVVQRGTDGFEGTGIYSVAWDGEAATAEVHSLLRELRENKVDQGVWKHTTGEFERINKL